eukprot:s3029_g2.t1
MGLAAYKHKHGVTMIYFDLKGALPMQAADATTSEMRSGQRPCACVHPLLVSTFLLTGPSVYRMFEEAVSSAPPKERCNIEAWRLVALHRLRQLQWFADQHGIPVDHIDATRCDFLWRAQSLRRISAMAILFHCYDTDMDCVLRLGEAMLLLLELYAGLLHVGGTAEGATMDLAVQQRWQDWQGRVRELRPRCTFGRSPALSRFRRTARVGLSRLQLPEYPETPKPV